MVLIDLIDSSLDFLQIVDVAQLLSCKQLLNITAINTSVAIHIHLLKGSLEVLLTEIS